MLKVDDLGNGLDKDATFTEDDLDNCLSLEQESSFPTKCGVCNENLKDPMILSCLHVYDRGCLSNLESQDETIPSIKCPQCSHKSGGVSSLNSLDLSLVQRSSDRDEDSAEPVKCSECTSGNLASYRCLQCSGTLCEQCNGIHKVMKVFASHKIIELTAEEKKHPQLLMKTMQNAKPKPCRIHVESSYHSFCLQCSIPLCDVCLTSDHRDHVTCELDIALAHLEPSLDKAMRLSQDKKQELKTLSEKMEVTLPEVANSRDNNKRLIEVQCEEWKAALDAIRDKYIERNRKMHEDLEMSLWSKINVINKTMDHIDYATEFTEKYLKKCSNVDMCELMSLVIACCNSFASVAPDSNCESRLDFHAGAEAPKDVMQRYFGSFGQEKPADVTLVDSHATNGHSNGFLRKTSSDISSPFDLVDSMKHVNMKTDSEMMALFMSHQQHHQPQHRAPCADRAGLNQISPSGSQASSGGRPAPVATLNGHHNQLNALISSADGSNALSSLTNTSPWSSMAAGGNVGGGGGGAGSENMGSNEFDPIGVDTASLLSGHGPGGTDLDQHYMKPKMAPSMLTPSLYEYSRLRNARCSQMNLLTKWGSMGCELGRLSSPHGFCLGFDEEIVVADTHNHRIQIFSKRGHFISFFGVSGRVDGLLWYPRKVAIIRMSQRYVVCDRGNERSRMQLFSRSGHFVRRIAIRYIDIVAGLAINQHGHIVAIDSVSPSVFVVSEEGDLIKWFDCSNHMREPSDVAIHGREYYICDFKAHCVVVFQEDGRFIRRIGGENITDYPNGIDVSDHGDVLVGDSHGNRFHIAVFNSQGDLQCEYVCNQTKVSRSCCLKITTEGYVVTLARSSNNVLVIDTLYVC